MVWAHPNEANNKHLSSYIHVPKWKVNLPSTNKQSIFIFFPSLHTQVDDIFVHIQKQKQKKKLEINNGR
jgi:hypothetical protein